MKIIFMIYSQAKLLFILVNKAEGKYLDSLKSEASKAVTNIAPYALPDCAELI